MLQPERDAGFKPPEKPSDFLTRALRPCERATVSTRKGHSWSATVAFLQARLGPFSPVFGPLCVSIIFKRLIVNVLKTSPKSLIYAEWAVRCKYRKHRGRKRTNSLTIILFVGLPCQASTKLSKRSAQLFLHRLPAFYSSICFSHHFSKARMGGRNDLPVLVRLYLPRVSRPIMRSSARERTAFSISS